MLVGLLIGWVIGMIIGRFFRDPKPVCPAEVLGYTCKFDKGGECDHRESAVLKAQMDMALWREQRDENERPL